ncbi:hypothetical protein F5X68DRAFT_203579 [Plectosphaerella plurivora]|uniref:Secreted protein n=1 Tax=Plectosphaerella plurivora TaxID=936078 RepID=A0A9P8VH61_9PEZI|nr:hypothetical protein F5X68DRAFT_203579 [Plectosphaerella plurivora]
MIMTSSAVTMLLLSYALETVAPLGHTGVALPRPQVRLRRKNPRHVRLQRQSVAFLVLLFALPTHRPRRGLHGLADVPASSVDVAVQRHDPERSVPSPPALKWPL